MYSTRIFFVFLCCFILSCSQSDTPLTNQKSDEYAAFIHSHTSGLLSTEGEIRVTLAQEPSQKPERGSLFSISPSIRGSEHWIDDRTIAFKPNTPLKPGTDYEVTFTLGDVMDVPPSVQKISFGLATIHQDMEVRIDEILLDDESDYVIRGTVFTADAAQKEDVRKTLNAQIDGRIGMINWPESTDKRRHIFEITDITRSDFDTKLTIKWNGSSIGASTTGSREIPIPATGTFSLLDTKIIYDQNPHIELTFSDVLNQRQQLDGLIRLGEDDQLNTIIQGNRIRVFYATDDAESVPLRIERGIKSLAGRTLSSAHEENVRLRHVQPTVRLTGRGVIIPSSGKMLVPFEATGLGAVDVRVDQIFENNIPQFLQTNDLSGEDDLRRVGKAVVGTTIPLTSLGTFDPNRWTNFALDLSPLMETEPGAIYRVTIGFRPHHRAISCAGENTPANYAELEADHWLLDAQEESDWWDNYDYFWWSDNFSWRDRENPCTDSYYSRERWVSRNVLASDLGIIAKASESGEMDIFVTDLITTNSRSGVDVELFSYQMQPIQKSKTGSNGHAKIQLDEEASLLIATDGDSKGYLRLENGRALSLSTFDVSGATVQEGLKGYLYGERGVWRPGDSLFVSLILEDNTGRLPEKHPVQFELRNPMGQVMERKSLTNGKNGFFTYHTKTEPTAPTGLWSVTARVGGVQFSKNLRIETIRPNRLDIQLNLDEETLVSTNPNIGGNIVSKWLHGAPASNLKTDISLTLAEASTRFSSFPNYVFDDITRTYTGETESIFEGTLDAEGTTAFRHSLPSISEAPGRLRGSLTTRVFEQSGNFSTVRNAFEYYPYESYVGLQLPEPNRDTGGLDRNQDHELQFVTLDSKGNPVTRSELEITIYEMGWRWWWQQPGDGSGLYFSTENLEPISRFNGSTDSDGRGAASFSIGDIYGRILIRIQDPQSGHASSNVAYVGYSWRDDDSSGEGPARLAIRTDRDNYSTGEKATVTFPSSEGSRALISLENGSKVLKTFWVDAQAGETSIPVDITPEMSPNVYAHVMLLQPHDSMANDLPLRLYGVVPVSVENPDSRLNPVLTVPTETKPKEQMTVKVKEENGKPMTYTLAVVDEGLLSLTNFRTPDPHATFYAREALGIKTWDMFDMVSGPFTGNMSRILAIGGDREAGEVNLEPEINRFKPVVKFLGPFEIGARQEMTHSIDIPNYVGSVRVMVVAGQDGAYGNTSKNVPVRQSLMALATLPRVLGPGEQVEFPVTLFTGVSTSGNVDVSIQSSESVSAIETTRQQFRMDANDQQMALFKLKTGDYVGRADITAQASVGNEHASDSIEIEIRNPNPPVTTVYQQLIEPGENWTVTPEIIGMMGTNRMTLEVSAIAPLDLERRTRYLINYPHGCLEQVVSSVFPQLYLSSFSELSEEQKQAAEENINAAIQELRAFQSAAGSLGYWPGAMEVNEWSNVYAYHFLIEAENKGFHVPSNLKSGLERTLRSKSLQWRTSVNHNDALIQSYRLYALALNGTAELGAMNRLRELSEIPTAAQWRLAAAYQLAGQPEAAIDVSSRSGRQVEPYKEWGVTFGSALRDRALILESLSLMDRRMEAASLAEEISEELASDTWLSTQETAYSLIAMARYLDGLETSSQMDASFAFGEDSGVINTSLPISSLSLSPQRDTSFQLKNEGEGVLYSRIIVQGTPLEGIAEPSSNALDITVRYLNPDGTEANPERLLQGSDIIVETSVSHPSNAGQYSELALTHILPSGWEIHNSRMDDISFPTSSSVPDYQDIRDDRILTYFGLKPGETKVFRTQVNASYAGRFYLPSVRAYAMYDESIFAQTGGLWVDVIRE